MTQGRTFNDDYHMGTKRSFGGDYNSTFNWSAGVPNSSNDIAVFGPANHTVIYITSSFFDTEAWIFNVGRLNIILP